MPGEVQLCYILCRALCVLNLWKIDLIICRLLSFFWFSTLLSLKQHLFNPSMDAERKHCSWSFYSADSKVTKHDGKEKTSRQLIAFVLDVFIRAGIPFNTVLCGAFMFLSLSGQIELLDSKNTWMKRWLRVSLVAPHTWGCRALWNLHQATVELRITQEHGFCGSFLQSPLFSSSL